MAMTLSRGLIGGSLLKMNDIKNHERIAEERK
jgi:hypothetical protein